MNNKNRIVYPAVAGIARDGVAEGGLTDELVWGFDYPHRPGTICLEPCGQCGEPGRKIAMAGINGERLPRTPLFIVAEATQEDWDRSRKARGGIEYSEPYPHYYFVRTD